MTRDAVSGGALKMIARVAAITGQRQMSASQCKIGEAGVIETRYLPLDQVVARITRGWKSGRSMVQYRGLKVLDMTTDALRAQARIDARCGSLVARIASRAGMRAKQWEAVPVIADGSNIGTPALNCVTLVTLCPELPCVEICVAVGALPPGLGEHFRNMATVAGHLGVHSAECIMSVCIMVKLDTGTKRRPTRRCMTVLTRHLKLSVWISNGTLTSGHQRHSERNHNIADRFDRNIRRDRVSLPKHDALP